MMHPIIISEINDKRLAWAPITYLSNLLKDKNVDSKQAAYR